MLHVRVLWHAGPLWRDEISSLRIATMPTLSGSWAALVYDPVPALFFFILHIWNSVFAGGDSENLRYLGFLIGLATVTSIWWASRLLKGSPPTWAMLLFGLSPVALVWGDSLRAYGIGCLFNILALAFLWKILCERPRRADIVWTSAAALLSVHSLFPNSLLLFAALTGAVVVTVRHRWWQTTRIILGIGAFAAFSLLPYASIIRQTQDWSGICQSPITWSWIGTMLFRATASGGNLAAILWLSSAIIVCLALVRALARPRFFPLKEEQTNLVLFSGITLLIAIALTISFFRWVGWATSLWYYLPLMATAIFCFEAIATLWRGSATARIAQSCLVVLAAVALMPKAFEATGVRLTNVDLTAQEIARRAGPEDLVVVDYYFHAISFQHYYQGKAPWVAVPNVADVSMHRWDLLAATMDRTKPVDSVLRRIDRTLQTGHDVYVVGLVPTNKELVAPLDLPPTSENSFGRNLWPYVRRWSSQVAFTAQTHSTRVAVIPVPSQQPISTAETVRAMVVSGWKDTASTALR